MKNTLTAIIACLTWAAVILQYYIMLENPSDSLGEMTIRFFSYFTILSNTLVSLYFTLSLISRKNSSFLNKPGTLTALTVYITIVCLIYQFILRQTWNPTGLHKVADELLHSVNPILVIIFWYLYEAKNKVSFKQIPGWLLYPLVYLVYILIRGKCSSFYPYPFVDVAQIGLQKVLINSLFITLLFVAVSAGFVTLGQRIKN